MKKWRLVNWLVCLGLLVSLLPQGGLGGQASEAVHAQSPRNVDIVFVMDTSESMDDDFSALCNSIETLVTNLQAKGVNVRYQILGITDTNQCATGTVRSTVAAPTVDQYEDWGPAVRDLSVGYQWQPGTTRLIIPLSDEAPEDGDDCEAPGPDEDAIRQAVTAATANHVRVAPIMARGYDDYGSCPADLAQQLASGTGGHLFFSTTPADDLAQGIEDLIGAVVADRDGDGIADDDDSAPDDPCQPDPQAVCLARQICGVSNTPHWDDDQDGTTDEELPNGTDDDGDGLEDEDVGGPNCPYPEQDCGVNSHRGFDDDKDAQTDEEADNDVDDDGDSYVDEDVACPCPQEQNLGVDDTPGVDDDHDFLSDEEQDDEQDNDNDGCIDEDVGVYAQDAQIDSISFDHSSYSSLVNKPMYARGVDTVKVDIEVSSRSGGLFVVTGHVVDAHDNQTKLAIQNASLVPGETEVVEFAWDVPGDAMMWEYTLGVEVNQTDGTPVDSEEVADAFFVAGVTQEEIGELEWECMSAWEVCGVATVGVVPYVGIPANWVAISDILCQVNHRFSNGDPIGGVLSLFRTINAFLEAVHDIGGAVTGVFEITSAVHSAIGGAADCAESHLHEFLKDECGPRGYTCWVSRMFSDLGAVFKKNTTVVVLTPSESAAASIGHSPLLWSATFDEYLQNYLLQTHTAYAADASSSARLRLADSNGDFIEFTDQGKRNIGGVGMVYNLGDEVQMAILEGTGSYKDLELLGQTNGMVDLHVLQVNEDGTKSQVTFGGIETTSSSIAAVNISSNGTTSDLKLDRDGDGFAEESIVPGVASGGNSSGSSFGGFGVGFLILFLVIGTVTLVLLAQRRRQPVMVGLSDIGRRDSARLVVTQGKQAGSVIAVNQPELSIGRSQIARIRLSSRAVSRRHAVIRYAQGRWFLQDQGSRHGTFVNGQQIEATALNHGDRITIGDTEFEFRLG